MYVKTLFNRIQGGLDSGAALLNRLTSQAIRRVGPDHVVVARELFTPDEREKLAYSMAATLGTGELLGRSTVRLKARHARLGRLRVYAEPADDTGYRGDQYIPAGIRLFTPKAALEYFQGLAPELGIDPRRWETDLERQAFTVTQATEQGVLNRLRDIVISGMMEGTPGGAQSIRGILDQAGMLPSNPQYSDMVYRTNVLDAHAVGHDREMQDPDMQETFPAWLYSSVIDKNSRPEHARRNDRMYICTLPFVLVRGTTANDVCNCRCLPIDLDRWDVEDRLAAGQRLYTSAAA